MIFWLLDHALQLQSVGYTRRLMGSKTTRLGSPTNLLSSLAGFANIVMWLFVRLMFCHTLLWDLAQQVLLLPGLDPALRAGKGYLVLLLLEVHVTIIIINIIIMIIIGGLFSWDAVNNNIIPCILSDIVFARSSLSILEFLEIISGNEHGDLVSIEEGIE